MRSFRSVGPRICRSTWLAARVGGASVVASFARQEDQNVGIEVKHRRGPVRAVPIGRDVRGDVFGACSCDCHRTANSRFDPLPTRASRTCASDESRFSSKIRPELDACGLRWLGTDRCSFARREDQDVGIERKHCRGIVVGVHNCDRHRTANSGGTHRTLANAGFELVRDGRIGLDLLGSFARLPSRDERNVGTTLKPRPTRATVESELDPLGALGCTAGARRRDHRFTARFGRFLDNPLPCVAGHAWARPGACLRTFGGSGHAACFARASCT